MQAKVAPDEKAARRFQSAMREVMRISGKDFETVIKHELGAALTSAVKMTKKATVKTIQNNHEKRPGAQYSFDYSGPESRTGKQYTPGEIARLRQRAAQRRAACSEKRGRDSLVQKRWLGQAWGDRPVRGGR